MSKKTKKNPPRKWGEDEIKTALQLRKQGVTIRAIATALNRGSGSVDYIINRENNPKPYFSAAKVAAKKKTSHAKPVNCRVEKKPSHVGSMIGDYEDGNVYLKAALLINGSYKGGRLFYSNGIQLTQQQTLELIRKVAGNR